MGFLPVLPHCGDAGAATGDLDEAIGGCAPLLLTTACESTVTSRLKVLFCFLNKTESNVIKNKNK